MSWEHREWAGGGGYREGGRFADNPLNWAPTIGTVSGIRVRVHILFILFIFIELLGAKYSVSYTAQCMFVLFGSVLLHEFGHCLAGRRVGGFATDILMWPLGGLATVEAPRRPWPQFLTVVFGPLVNVALFSIAAGLMWSGVFGERSVPFNPFFGWESDASTWANPRLWARLIFQINWVLFLFNLWPMYPMDGGRMLQCVLWWKLGHNRSLSIATTVGMVAAIVLGFYGLANQQWMLLAIAIMGYMACRNERMLLKFGAYDGSEPQGPRLDLSQDRPRRDGWLTRLRKKRHARALELHREIQASLQEEVDRILEKVHQNGIQSLTEREKKTLADATHKQQAAGRR